MYLWDREVYVAGKHLYKGEYLIVIGNSRGDLMADYRLRWKIETTVRDKQFSLLTMTG